MVKRAAAMGLAMAALVGCATTDPDRGDAAVAELRVEPTEARAGGEVMLTLENRSDAELGYNLCPSVLDRRTEEGWEQWPQAPAEICTMELRMLPIGSSSSYRHTLPSRLEPGEYRFRTGVEVAAGEDWVQVASEAFEVIP
jgi:hypothetical protein